MQKRDGAQLRHDQEALLTKVIAHISRGLAADERVEAVWLGGSLSRGEGDALSDVDLTIAMTPAGARDMATQRLRVVQRLAAPPLGPLAIHLDSPQNAPRHGGQVNALYDVEPLPLYVDWSFWPWTGERPADLRVLYERDSLRLVSGRTSEEIQRAMPHGSTLPVTPARLNHFRVAMLPIVAKLAARGRTDDVRRMFETIAEPPPASLGLYPVLERLRAVLESLRGTEPTAATRCILRYLDTLPQLVE